MSLYKSFLTGSEKNLSVTILILENLDRSLWHFSKKQWKPFTIICHNQLRPCDNSSKVSEEKDLVKNSGEKVQKVWKLLKLVHIAVVVSICCTDYKKGAPAFLSSCLLRLASYRICGYFTAITFLETFFHVIKFFIPPEF